MIRRTDSRNVESAGFSAIELLIVVALIGVIAAIATPMTGNALGYFRLSGDARSITNSIAVAKMRAAATFTQARLYVDLSTGSFHTETWRKTGTPGWSRESGQTYLSGRDAFGWGVVASPPPDTQPAISEAPPCLDDTGHAIGNTSCVVFNSRGIPIDGSGAPTPLNALYVTDGTAVFGATVSATGTIRLWRTQFGVTPAWALQ